jgi:uncharacterized membrane protein YjdF
VNDSDSPILGHGIETRAPKVTSYLILMAMTVALLVVNAAFATVPGYRVAPALLTPLLVVVFLLRNRLDVSPVGYGMFCTALLLHDLGAYGYYQVNPTGYSFDMYVHFYFAVTGTVILHRAMRRHLPWKGWQVALATVLFIMGVGAIHEIMEYCSTLVLGEEHGMIKKTSYRFDTERDLTSNLCGCITAMIGWCIYYAIRKPPRPLAHGANPGATQTHVHS